MTIGMVFLTLLMGVIVVWLLRHTVNVQPWVAAAVEVSPAPPRPPARTALWVFLGVATSLFALFVSAYAMRLGGLPDWSPMPRPRLLVLNTALLAAASLAMEWAAHAARRGRLERVPRGLAAAGMLTLGFVAGQLFVWWQLQDAGYYAATSPAAAFFYLLTAVHGLHVAGGLVAWARAMLRVRRAPDPARVRLGVGLCATYWHYLLAVWVVLYALLVSSDLGLAICSSASL